MPWGWVSGTLNVTTMIPFTELQCNPGELELLARLQLSQDFVKNALFPPCEALGTQWNTGRAKKTESLSACAGFNLCQ